MRLIVRLLTLIRQRVSTPSPEPGSYMTDWADDSWDADAWDPDAWN